MTLIKSIVLEIICIEITKLKLLKPLFLINYICVGMYNGNHNNILLIAHSL